MLLEDFKKVAPEELEGLTEEEIVKVKRSLEEWGQLIFEDWLESKK